MGITRPLALVGGTWPLLGRGAADVQRFFTAGVRRRAARACVVPKRCSSRCWQPAVRPCSLKSPWLRPKSSLAPLASSHPASDGLVSNEINVLQDSAVVAFTSFRIRAWTVEDGLLGRASRVAQTPDGYLWVTTDEGLFRFDGARFVGFSTANVPAFRSDVLLSVDVLASGDLWVGSEDGWTYRLREGAWTAYPIAEAFGPTTGSRGSWRTATGRSGRRARAGRSRASTAASGSSSNRDSGTSGPRSWRTPRGPLDVPRRLRRAGRAPVPAALTPPPQHRCRGAVGRPAVHAAAGLAALRLRGDAIRTALPPAGRGGEAPLPVDEPDLRVQLLDADGTPRGAYVMGDVPRSAHLVDRAGRVWTERIVSDGSVTVLDGDTEVARIQPEGSTWIETLFEDRQGNVWVLSSAGSLLQVTPEPFRRFGPDEGAPLAAEAAVVTSDGTVLVSATQGAEEAPLFAVHDGVWTSHVIDVGLAAFRDEDLSRRSTVGLVQEDGRGRRFGVYGSRLAQIDGGRVVRVWWSQNGHTLQLPFPDPADPDALWVGDDGGRLWRFDTEAFAPTDSFRVPDPPIGLARPTDVHRAADGRLWVASRGGLLAVGEDDQLHPVEALAGVPVRDLADGPDGSLWAATETRGLVRIRDGGLDAFGPGERLPTPHLVAVLFDDQGFVWLKGRTLLYRARTEDVERALDGPASEPVDVVTLPPSAGHLGSTNSPSGRPRRRRMARSGSPPAWASRGSTRPRTPASSPSRRPCSSRPSDRAPGSACRRRPARRPPAARGPLARGGLHGPRPDGPRPRPLPDPARGLDDGWQDQGAARSVVYGGLGPGTYTFRVQARNGGGVWSEPVEATLVVPAFFYETVWFAALCGLGLLAALVLGVRARERALTARRRRLEALVGGADGAAAGREGDRGRAGTGPGDARRGQERLLRQRQPRVPDAAHAHARPPRRHAGRALRPARRADGRAGGPRPPQRRAACSTSSTRSSTWPASSPGGRRSAPARSTSAPSSRPSRSRSGRSPRARR